LPVIVITNDRGDPGQRGGQQITGQVQRRPGVVVIAGGNAAGGKGGFDRV